MTSAATIHAFALLGLRALAEYDPFAYARSTDMTKADLDHRITSLIGEVDDERLRNVYSELLALVSEAGTPDQLRFVARFFHDSCMQRAYHLSLTREPGATGAERVATTSTHQFTTEETPAPLRDQQQFLRLAVMRLMHDFRSYTAQFEYRWKHQVLDCVLDSGVPNAPVIAVQAAHTIRNDQEFLAIRKQLERFRPALGRPTLGAIVTTSANSELRQVLAPTKQDRILTFLLVFDVEANEFVGHGYAELSRVIHWLREL